MAPTRSDILRGITMAMTIQNVTGSGNSGRPSLKIISDKITLPNGVEIEPIIPVSNKIVNIADFIETNSSATTKESADSFVSDIFSRKLGIPEWVWKGYIPIIRSNAYSWEKDFVYKMFPRTVEVSSGVGSYPVKILDSTITVPAEDYGMVVTDGESGTVCTFTYPDLPVGLFSVYSGNNYNGYAYIHLGVYPESMFTSNGTVVLPPDEDFYYSWIRIMFSRSYGTQFWMHQIRWHEQWSDYVLADWSSMKYYNGKKIKMTSLYEV